MTLEAGTMIGAYRILEQVGRGGMATVYKAYQPALARNVAIKVLPSYLADDEVFRERFRAEAVTIARLRHPNILAVFDFGSEGGVNYIVTEFVDGGTLADQLASPLPAEYVARMLAPVASALDYAHARDVIHRDVKPSNILIARDGTPVVSDFGLARLLLGSLPRLTQTGSLVGTPEYMAPEQAGGETAGPPADRYALAVIAYEMLVGSVPFSADTPLATLLAHLHKPLPIPHERNAGIAPAVEEVLFRGLAKDPAARYPSATEFVRALADAAALPATGPGPARTAATAATRSEQVTAPIVTARGNATRPGGSSRRRLIIGAIAAAVLVVAGTAAYVLTREPEAPPLSIDIELGVNTILVASGTNPSKVPVTITYSNNRDALLTDVVITLRPMRDARVLEASMETRETASGFEFVVGDVGPWARGTLGFSLTFSSTGSRVVQATVRSKELTAGFTTDAQTVNVTPAQ